MNFFSSNKHLFCFILVKAFIPPCCLIVLDGHFSCKLRTHESSVKINLYIGNVEDIHI